MAPYSRFCAEMYVDKIKNKTFLLITRLL